jgi:hypothetical protein
MVAVATYSLYRVIKARNCEVNYQQNPFYDASIRTYMGPVVQITVSDEFVTAWDDWMFSPDRLRIRRMLQDARWLPPGIDVDYIVDSMDDAVNVLLMEKYE